MSRYNTLMKLVEQRAPETILEIGTWNGKHAKQMIEIAKRRNPGKCITYIGFDLFEGFTPDLAQIEYCPKKPASYIEVESLLSRIPDTRIYLIRGNTKDTLPEFLLPACITKRAVDFIFLDGGHSIGTIRSDYDNIGRFVDNDTFVVLDDYYHDENLSKEYGCNELLKSIDPYHYTIEIQEPADPFNGGTSIVLLRKVP